jgi:hypothetical protein
MAAGRLRYLLAAFAFTTAFGFTAAAMGFLAPQIDSELLIGIGVIFSGSVGALLSVALGVNKLQTDPDDPLPLTVALASSRIIIGIIGAAFTYVLIRADALLGFVGSGNWYGSIAVGFLAGFSETLVPNILKKLDSQLLDNTQAGAGNDKPNKAMLPKGVAVEISSVRAAASTEPTNPETEPK